MEDQNVKQLKDRDIKLFMIYGKTVKFSVIENENIVFCSDGVFEALFKESKYGHESKMKKRMSTDAEHKEGQKTYDFFSIDKYERYFLDYRVQASAYKKAKSTESDRYKNYEDFITKGGVNLLFTKAAEEAGIEKNRTFKNQDLQYLRRIESKMKPEVATKPQEEQRPKESKLRRLITDVDVYLWSVVLLVACLTPFTFLALLKYLALEGSGWELYLSYFMVAGLSISFDWSILVFTMNGKRILANIGSVFQVIFIAVHFNLLQDIAGTELQAYITKIFAVVYAAILINQFSVLSKIRTHDRFEKPGDV